MNAPSSEKPLSQELCSITFPNGVSRIVPLADAFAVADEMALQNPGVPEMALVNEDVSPVAIIVAEAVHVAELVDEDSAPTERAPSTVPPAPVYSDWTAQVVDEAAKERVEALHVALNAAGVPVDASQQLYATGTRMAAEGYATQEGRKADHDAKVSLVDAAHALAEVIRGEHREDVTMSARDFARYLAIQESKLTIDGKSLTEQAIKGFSARFSASGLATYLLFLDERAASFRAAGRTDDARRDVVEIASLLRHECAQAPDVALKLRTRNSTNNDIFAIVSPSFAPCDADALIGQLLDGMPHDAKGAFSYDATSTTWELRANVWTPTPVQEQCVGEPFEGYISLLARDNGTSRFRGNGGVTMLRCLNASTYVADTASASRVHRGDIMIDVERVIDEAKKSIDIIVGLWESARQDVILAPETVKIEDFMPGFWRHCLKESPLAKVALPVGRDEAVGLLTMAYHSERRDPGAITRADMVQGWTKAIQAFPMPVQRDAEIAAGALLASRKPIEWLAPKSA